MNNTWETSHRLFEQAERVNTKTWKIASCASILQNGICALVRYLTSKGILYFQWNNYNFIGAIQLPSITWEDFWRHTRLLELSVRPLLPGDSAIDRPLEPWWHYSFRTTAPSGAIIQTKLHTQDSYGYQTVHCPIRWCRSDQIWLHNHFDVLTWDWNCDEVWTVDTIIFWDVLNSLGHKQEVSNVLACDKMW